KDIPDALLSVSPEVRLPSVNNLEYISGNSYKGWYYLFIRYKINTVDYTQWYSVGFPIYVDTLEKYQIVRYCYNRETHLSQANNLDKLVRPNNPNDGFGAGFSDYFSNASDIAKETFKVNLYFSNINYDKYQIGIVCSSKSYIKAFRTSDINLESVNQTYTLDN